jgi:hypothetical protein
MNKHIEFVKEWLADPSSKTQEELVDNANAAADAWAADCAAADCSAADCAAYWAKIGEAEMAAEYVERYERLTK